MMYDPQHENIIEHIESSDKLEMIKCIRSQKIDMRRCDSGHMRHWNIQTMRMFSKARIEIQTTLGNFSKERE